MEKDLPYIIAGPIMRRLQPEQLVIWMVTREPLKAEFRLFHHEILIAHMDVSPFTQSIQIGGQAYIHLFNYRPESDLPTNEWLAYDFICEVGGSPKNLSELLPHLVYDNESCPRFVIKTQLDQVLHGSCRKPHYESDDALLRVDDVLAQTQEKIPARPALLLMSGDQIYADDVAGPMLFAIHQVIQLLELVPESIEGAEVGNSHELYTSDYCYYQREKLLPHTVTSQALKDMVFGGVRKPIFTADSAQNHLITLSEVLAMYLLVWSPQLWKFIRLDKSDIKPAYQATYLHEQKQVEKFAVGLARVQRALAHLPVYMIFDDHDVTDDWNLTRGWEEAAYGHSFSKQIIGNALIAYCLCQGWGNAPENFSNELIIQHQESCQSDELRKNLITQLLKFETWHYCLPTSPKLVVLDTRTRRWWSESSLVKPSGLMDWEALSDLQQELIGEKSVLLVSAAPIFGMKLIEIVQRIFAFFGHALIVDAENWMAHPGAANVILNIFLHLKTPQKFVILSGDVHYSFAYDIQTRHRKNSPDIWQITCSGFKNEFPYRLLKWFDQFNRRLYASRSPLNWFTKRRQMEICSRTPDSQPHARVLNQSAVGRVMLNDRGEPKQISVLPANGGEVYFFRS